MLPYTVMFRFIVFPVSRVAIQVSFSSLAGNTFGNVRLRKYELSNSMTASLSAFIDMFQCFSQLWIDKQNTTKLR